MWCDGRGSILGESGAVLRRVVGGVCTASGRDCVSGRVYVRTIAIAGVCVCVYVCACIRVCVSVWHVCMREREIR